MKTTRISRRYQETQLVSQNDSIDDPSLEVAMEAVNDTEYNKVLALEYKKSHSFEPLGPRTFTFRHRKIQLSFDISVSSIVFAIITLIFAVASISFEIVLQEQVPSRSLVQCSNLIVRDTVVVDKALKRAALVKMLEKRQNETNIGDRSIYSLSAQTVYTDSGNIHYLNRQKDISNIELSLASIIETQKAVINNDSQCAQFVAAGDLVSVKTKTLEFSSGNALTVKNYIGKKLDASRCNANAITSENMTIGELFGAGAFESLNVSSIKTNKLISQNNSFGRLGFENLKIDELNVENNANFESFDGPVEKITAKAMNINGSISMAQNSFMDNTRLTISGQALEFSQIAADNITLATANTTELSATNGEIEEISCQTAKGDSIASTTVGGIGNCELESIRYEEKEIVSSTGNMAINSIQGAKELNTTNFVVDGTFSGKIEIK